MEGLSIREFFKDLGCLEGLILQSLNETRNKRRVEMVVWYPPETSEEKVESGSKE